MRKFVPKRGLYRPTAALAGAPHPARPVATFPPGAHRPRRPRRRRRPRAPAGAAAVAVFGPGRYYLGRDTRESGPRLAAALGAGLAAGGGGIVDEVIAVDNNSRDRTAERIKGTTATYVLETRQGYGNALQRGLAEAASRGADLIVMAEPDGTFAGKDVLKLLAFSDDFDLVLGTRAVADRSTFAVVDPAGNETTTAGGADRSVTFDSIAPTITFAQAADQADPAKDATIRFTLASSEALDALIADGG